MAISEFLPIANWLLHPSCSHESSRPTSTSLQGQSLWHGSAVPTRHQKRKFVHISKNAVLRQGLSPTRLHCNEVVHWKRRIFSLHSLFDQFHTEAESQMQGLFVRIAYDRETGSKDVGFDCSGFDSVWRWSRRRNRRCRHEARFCKLNIDIVNPRQMSFL